VVPSISRPDRLGSRECRDEGGDESWHIRTREARRETWEKRVVLIGPAERGVTGSSARTPIEQAYLELVSGGWNGSVDIL